MILLLLGGILKLSQNHGCLRIFAHPLLSRGVCTAPEAASRKSLPHEPPALKEAAVLSPRYFLGHRTCLPCPTSRPTLELLSKMRYSRRRRCHMLLLEEQCHRCSEVSSDDHRDCWTFPQNDDARFTSAQNHSLPLRSFVLKSQQFPTISQQFMATQ